jgi:hypothetical protein
MHVKVHLKIVPFPRTLDRELMLFQLKKVFKDVKLCSVPLVKILSVTVPIENKS